MFTIRIGLLLCGRDGAGWERRSGKGEQDTVGTGKGKGEEGAKEGETRGKGTHSELGYPPSGTRRIGALGDMKCTGKREDERTGETVGVCACVCSSFAWIWQVSVGILLNCARPS